MQINPYWCLWNGWVRRMSVFTVGFIGNVCWRANEEGDVLGWGMHWVRG